MCSLTMKPSTFRRLIRMSAGFCQRQRLTVVAGDHAAHGNAAKGVGAQQHGVQHVAAHVLEIAVDALGAGFLERLQGHAFASLCWR
jgi:hypothetical protein